MRFVFPCIFERRVAPPRMMSLKPLSGSGFDRYSPFLVAGILAVGGGLRLIHYFDRRSLWLDEVWLSLNVAHRSFTGLMETLDYAQTAPVAFLWAERLAILLFGVNELSLRAFPMVAGIASLWLFWRLSRRWLPPELALFAVAIAALSPPLIYYSNEAKPYIVDAMSTIVILLLASDVLSDAGSRRGWLRLVAGGSLAILISAPAVFVLAAVGVALLVRPQILGRLQARRLLILAGTAWIAVFSSAYFLFYRETASDEYMQRIWAGAFLKPSLTALLARSADVAKWVASIYGDFALASPNGVLVPLAALSVLGVGWLGRRHGVSIIVLIVGPFGFMILASMMKLWPMTLRLLVFPMPLLILSFAAGLHALSTALPLRRRATALAVLELLVLLPMMAQGLGDARRPLRRDHIAPLVNDFRSRHARSSLVYVFAHAAPAWFFYSTDWSAPPDPKYHYQTYRADLANHHKTRGCVFLEPGVRTIYAGAWGRTDTGAWAADEAAWLAEQPEEEIWLLFLGYDMDFLHPLRAAIETVGGSGAFSHVHEDVALYQYRFPDGARRTREPQCEQI